MLDLVALCDSLIGDAGAIYEPRDYNDWLLLGIKGTLAEAQWYVMRQQLSAARLNKARRGGGLTCDGCAYNNLAVNRFKGQ